MIQLQEFLVKEEAKKVREVMEKISNMQVEKEKKDGEERMKAVLKKQREEFEDEKNNAVKEGRQEEQEKATNILTGLMKQHEDDIVRIRQQAEQTKQVQLQYLILVYLHAMLSCCFTFRDSYEI